MPHVQMDESLTDSQGGTYNNNFFAVETQTSKVLRPDANTNESKTGMRHPFSSSELFNAFSDPNARENRTMGVIGSQNKAKQMWISG